MKRNFSQKLLLNFFRKIALATGQKKNCLEEMTKGDMENW